MSTGARAPRVVGLARLDLRADRAGSLSLVLLLLVTTTLAMAAPIVFTRAADAALPAMMAAAPPLQRDLAFTLDGRLDGELKDGQYTASGSERGWTGRSWRDCVRHPGPGSR